MEASSSPRFRAVKTIVLFVFCAVPGLFATIFAPMFFYFEGVVRRDQSAMMWAAAITIVGVALLLVGLGSVKRWPFIIVFASIPWVLIGFAALINNELIAGAIAAAVALAAVVLIRRFNIAQ